MGEMNEELIWQFLTAFASGTFIAVISISTAVAGCGKKKDKIAESACSKPKTQLQTPSGNGAPTKSNGSKTPLEPKNSAEKKPEEKKPDEPPKEEKKEKTKEEKTKEEEKKPEEKKPEEDGEKTNLKTDTKLSAMTNKADSAHTKETTKKEASKNEKTGGKKEETDDQYQQVDFGPGDLPPPPPPK